MLWPAYATARAWVRSKSYRDQGEQLAELVASYARESGQKELLSHLMRDLAMWRVDRSGGVVPQNTGLAHWHAGGHYTTGGRQMGVWPGWWVEREGIVLHIAGPEVSPLFFAYPLEGDFTFQVDGFYDVSAEAAIQFGRVLFEPFWQEDAARILAIGQREWIRRAGPDRCPRTFLSTCDSCQSREGELSVRWSCRSRGSEPQSHHSLARTIGSCHAYDRLVQFSVDRQPKIPREVPLIDGHRMEGWMSPLYQEPIPRQLHEIEPSRHLDSLRRLRHEVLRGLRPVGVLARSGLEDE